MPPPGTGEIKEPTRSSRSDKPADSGTGDQESQEQSGPFREKLQGKCRQRHEIEALQGAREETTPEELIGVVHQSGDYREGRKPKMPKRMACFLPKRSESKPARIGMNI